MRCDFFRKTKNAIKNAIKAPAIKQPTAAPATAPVETPPPLPPPLVAGSSVPPGAADEEEVDDGTPRPVELAEMDELVEGVDEPAPDPPFTAEPPPAPKVDVEVVIRVTSPPEVVLTK